MATGGNRAKGVIQDQWLTKKLRITIRLLLVLLFLYIKIMEFIEDFVKFLLHRKKWWLIPIIIALALVGILLIFAEGSAIAPFVYPIF